MSQGRRGSETYRRGSSSTARSTTSVDTNVLLQRAATSTGLDTARSATSVDTDILLGELASPRTEEDPVHETQVLNSTYTRPISSSPSRHQVDEPVATVGDKVRFHADALNQRPLDRSLVSARSVASVDCAPVDYDEGGDDDDTERDGYSVSRSDVWKQRRFSEDRPPVGYDNHDIVRDHSLGFEASTFDQRPSSEASDVTVPGTGRSDASLEAAMRLRDSAITPVPGDDVTLEPGTTSRTLASVDTNVLLQTTEDVVKAMEVARTHHHQNDVFGQREFSPHRKDEFEDIISSAGNVRQEAADSESETSDLGKTRLIPAHRSVLTRPPLHGKAYPKSALRDGDVRQQDRKEAWGSVGDYDGEDNVQHSSPSRSRNRTSQLSHKKSSTAGYGSRLSDAPGRSDITGWRSQFDRRHYSAPRSRPLRTQSLLDSDRSGSSNVSLGQQIVAKSRQNQSRPKTTQSQKSSNSASGKRTQEERDLSPSGLVLEGCRVPMRPSTASNHEPRSQLRPSTVMRPRTATNTRGTAKVSATSGDHRTQKNGWIDDTSSLNDSLYSDSQRDLHSFSDEREVSDALVSFICHLSANVKSQTDQLVSTLRHRLKVAVDLPPSMTSSVADAAHQSLQTVLNDLQSTAFHLLAVNKALSTVNKDASHGPAGSRH